MIGLITKPVNAWVIPDQKVVFERLTKHGAVASESGICSEIGIELMKRGVSSVSFFLGVGGRGKTLESG